MLFNSLDFALFLPLVFLLYWFVARRSLKQQNVLLLLASYVFYAQWDWRFLFLIVISSFVDYFASYGMTTTEDPRRRKLFLILSLLVNLGFLGFFKYYNFFAENFSQAFTLFGSSIEANRLSIVLPVGISFYTFQTLSYSIDVYRKKLEPTRDLVAFFAYVAFFPQLVAGPIERATNLLPQFRKSRSFDYSQAADGMRQILWGLFKKMVVADNCAPHVDAIFGAHADYSGSTLIVGAIFFAFQIYGDFSGYSDIAIGTSRLFGFNLMKNFDFPYFSRDIAEFWRRWHISLSTWFRDYLYIPLGGSRGGTSMRVRNTFIIFIVSGFWHGANWTFVVWGALNALYFLPLLLTNQNRRNLDVVAQGRILPSLVELGQISRTFALTVLAWIFFRAESLGHAFSYLAGILSLSTFSMPEVLPRIPLLAIAFLLGVEWIQRDKEHGLELTKGPASISMRWGIYLLLVFAILALGGNQQEFIYFQF